LQFAIKHIKRKIYGIIIMPVVLYGSESCSLTLWKESKLRMFENRVLRRIVGPNGEELSGRCGKLRVRNEKLNDLYSLSRLIRMMRSRRMRWVEHVALMRRGEVRTDFRWGNLRDKDNLEDPDVDGRIILRCVFRSCDGGRGVY
jgi:hypothetical protein